MFILVALLLQELTVFFLQSMVCSLIWYDESVIEGNFKEIFTHLVFDNLMHKFELQNSTLVEDRNLKNRILLPWDKLG